MPRLPSAAAFHLSSSWHCKTAKKGQGHRAPNADVETIDALHPDVTQAERIGALREAALVARIDQRKMTCARAEKFGGIDAVGEVRTGAAQKHQGRLLIGEGGAHMRLLAASSVHFLGD